MVLNDFTIWEILKHKTPLQSDIIHTCLYISVMHFKSSIFGKVLYICMLSHSHI